MPAMEAFVSWDLENEHGDLGLNSPNDSKPALSRFGYQLKRHQTRGKPPVVKALRNNIVYLAKGNISLAKLHLAGIHESPPDVDDILGDPPGLTDDFIAFFNNGIAAIEAQPDDQAKLGLRALIVTLAILGPGDSTEESLPEFLHKVRLEESSCTIANTLRATRGFLSIVTKELEVGLLLPFNESFGEFISDGYCDSVRKECHKMAVEFGLELCGSDAVSVGERFELLKDRIRVYIYQQPV